MARIELRSVQKFFGAVQVLKDVNLTIEDGEFVVMLGQSGCGKTTTLRAIAGLETVSSGTITIEGREVQNLRAADRDIAFVFQSFSLYPHMTVQENIAFPLRAVGMSQTDRDAAVTEVAKVLGIERFLHRKPSALSGGDMQRVAIGRALVRRPKALLMDEPIGALDAKLREQMRAEIKRLHIARSSTSVYVTHDQIEAMSLADRIVVMHAGLLQQVGAPEEVYNRPANLFVAQFVGSPVMNVLDVAVEGGAGAAVLSFGQGVGIPVEGGLVGHLSNQRPVKLGIRPEAVLLRQTAEAGFVETETTNIEPLGSHEIVDVSLGDATLRVRVEPGFVANRQRVWVGLDSTRAHFFDTETGSAVRRIA
ncbi:MAG: ABC transporter ATP-binding protein [bacterium]